jgi:hypothetical protein
MHQQCITINSAINLVLKELSFNNYCCMNYAIFQFFLQEKIQGSSPSHSVTGNNVHGKNVHGKNVHIYGRKKCPGKKCPPKRKKCPNFA